MGPEPFELTADQWRDILPENRLLKTSLMDQRVVAGLGNIAISEIFWRAGLHPRVKCGELTDEQVEALAEIVPDYLEEVIAAETSDEITYIEESGAANPFDIYRREECPRCGAEVEKMNVGGRSTYFCPECQTA
jgi:formamidopyrimidine-DNA glycosylase